MSAVDYKNLFNLTGKRAVVIGGGGGIGGAIAEGYAVNGAKVAIVGRTMERLQKRASEIKTANGAEVACFSADCTDEAAVSKLYDDVMAKFGGVEILVNSQGVNKKYSVMEHPLDAWEEMFAGNVRSVMLTCKYFGRNMKDMGYGRIINISSIGSIRTKANDISTCYGSTKAALNSFTMNIAAGWAQYGITVNCIGPIMTKTDMMKPIFEKNPELLPSTAARVPAGRAGEPEDCVGPAIFFASDASSFVTGQIIYPDGGLCTQM